MDGDIILVDILPNGNIIKITEGGSLYIYDPTSYLEQSSKSVNFGSDTSHICDAAVIDSDNFLLVTYNKMYTWNWKTQVLTDVGVGLPSDKQTDPMK